MIDAPIFHVNGDDPEAVVFAAKVGSSSAEIPQAFVIDISAIVGTATTKAKPALPAVMYKKIATHPSRWRLFRR